ncbi:MAG: response regulator transcription factor [Acidobacteriaceae bacterium]
MRTDLRGDAPFGALIVDRDSMSSDLLARALEHERVCAATAVPSADLLRTLPQTTASLVVLGADLRTETGDGFSLAQAVGRAHPGVFTVLLIPVSSREAVINAFRAGARGVLARERPLVEFVDCVKRVHQGYLWVRRQEASFLLQAFRNIPAPNIQKTLHSPNLTVRELQVVERAAMGRTNRAIALELRLSEHTVKNYLFRAFEKLGVGSRIELLFYLTVTGRNPRVAETDPTDTEAVSGDVEAESA